MLRKRKSIKKYRLIFLLFISFWGTEVAKITASQRLIPFASSFSPLEYGADNQNWAVAQLWNDMLCFGNNEGLLLYDGWRWELMKFHGNNGVVRALYTDNKAKRLYAGSFEEFGYYTIDPYGAFLYTSLSDSLQGYTFKNDEIWNIVPLGDTLFFQSFASFFIYDGKQVKAVSKGEIYLFFYHQHNQLYTDVRGKGVMHYNPISGLFDKPLGTAQLGRVVSGFDIPRIGQLLITESEGIRLKSGNTLTRIDHLGSDWPTANRAIITRDSVVVLGTIDKGLFAFDCKGELLWVIDNSCGLANNTVLNLMEDNHGDIWATLDKGIAQIHKQSPFLYCVTNNQSIGSAYTAAIIDDTYYLGTNYGLFSATSDGKKWSDYKRLPGIYSQVWDIATFDGQTIVGTNDNTYLLEKNGLKLLSEVHGGMAIDKGVIFDKEVLIQGTYSNLCVYTKNETGRWGFHAAILDFVEPIDYIQIDYQGIIWAAHRSSGFYKITLDRSLSKAESIVYYPSLEGEKRERVFLFMIENRVVFSNGKGFYVFNDITHKIEPYKELNIQLAPYKEATRIHNVGNGRYWIIDKNSAVLMQIVHGTLKALDLQEYPTCSVLLNNEQRNVFPLNNGDFLFTLDNGFALYNVNFKDQNENKKEKLFVSSFEAIDKKNQTIYYPINGNAPIKLGYNSRDIVIKLAYPVYRSMQNSAIFHRLRDSNGNEIKGVFHNRMLSFTSLPIGKYKLKVWIENEQGDILTENEIVFEQLPPFYLTLWAKIIYALSVIVLSFGSYMLFKRYLAKHKLHIKEQLRKEQEEEYEKREQTIVKLRNENLEKELVHKGKELANYTLHEIRRNEVLVTIRAELCQQKVTLGAQFPKKYFDKLIALIDENSTNNDDWALFQSNFDLIHEKFFRNLRAHYPDLTPYDLRLCAYLRLNLQSKEIADLLHITPKGVEVARYRLRKKLNLTQQESLVDFMIDLT